MLWNRSCLHFLVRFVHPHLSTYIWFCKKWVTYCHEHFNIYFFLLHMNFFLILQIISSGHFQQNQLYSHCLLSLSLSSLEPSRLHLQKFLHFFFSFFPLYCQRAIRSWCIPLSMEALLNCIVFALFLLQWTALRFFGWGVLLSLFLKGGPFFLLMSFLTRFSKINLIGWGCWICSRQ